MKFKNMYLSSDANAICISDLHLTEKKKNNNKECNEEKLVAKLKTLIGIVTHIFILGDFLTLGNQNKCIQRYPDLMGVMSNFIVIIIPGNHDSNIKMKNLPKNFSIIKRPILLDFCGKKYILLHGHKWDLDIDNISDRIKRCVLQFVKHVSSDKYEELSQKMKLGSHGKVSKFNIMALKLHKKTGCKVIFGHTHSPFTLPMVVNTGAWVKSNSGNNAIYYLNRKGDIDERKD